jgi:uncharacterized protein YjiK
MYFKTIIKLSIIFILTACADTHKIASIPEASGISYCQNSNTLMVANDEGSYYEITPNGKILASYKLGDYDLEGVVCEDKRVIFAVEDGSLLTVSRDKQKIKQYKVKGKKIKFSKKSGIEGLVKIDNLYYLAIQTKKKKDAKILVVKLGDNYAKIIRIIEQHVKDSAGLEYRDNKLYIVSDKKDKLYIYDLKLNKIIKKIKLPKFAQEGIAFGKENRVFFADDDGAVFKYSKKELKIP